MGVKIQPQVLKQFLTASEEEVAALCHATQYGTPLRPYWYADNGSKLLAVAHLDWVHAAEHAPQFITCQPTGRTARTLVFHPALDDRLGAYIIGSFLPRLGVVADILFTTNEEHGQSTASEFKTDKQYNWLFQFDRRGSDVVGYKYESDPTWGKALRDVKLTRGNGSFSDIAVLDLGVLGFNFGTGYHDEHTVLCYADLLETVGMINGFLDFYELHAEQRLTYTPSKPHYYTQSYVGGRVWRDGHWVYEGQTGWEDAHAYQAPKNGGNGVTAPPKSGDAPAAAPTGASPAPVQASAPPVAPPTSPTPEQLPILTPDEIDALAMRESTPVESAHVEIPDAYLAQLALPPFSVGAARYCSRCAQQRKPLYYDTTDKAYLCETCIRRILFPTDLVYGTCMICDTEAYISARTIMRGEACCYPCDIKFYANLHANHGGV